MTSLASSSYRLGGLLHGAFFASALALVAAPGALAQAPPPAGFPGTPPPSPPVVILEFSAEPATILTATERYSLLRWEVSNAYALTIEPGIGVVPTRGARRVTPAATTTYTLTAIGPGDPVTRTVTVAVTGTTAVSATPPAAAPQPLPIPRLADGKPDLSGVWAADRNVRLVNGVKSARGAEALRVTEAGERDTGSADDCLPPGVPAVTMLPFPFQIVQTPDVVAFLYEAYHQFRVAGVGQEAPLHSTHPEYLAPTWMGHSVAWWDGDTLSVDARGFNGRLVIAGYRTTERLRVLEHYRRASYDTIAYEAYVFDDAFAEGLHYSGTLTLHPEWEIGEYVCAENNQDYDELFEED
jgi:hypothetical protein